MLQIEVDAPGAEASFSNCANIFELKSPQNESTYTKLNIKGYDSLCNSDNYTTVIALKQVCAFQGCLIIDSSTS